MFSEFHSFMLYSFSFLYTYYSTSNSFFIPFSSRLTKENRNPCTFFPILIMKYLSVFIIFHKSFSHSFSVFVFIQTHQSWSILLVLSIRYPDVHFPPSLLVPLGLSLRNCCFSQEWRDQLCRARLLERSQHRDQGTEGRLRVRLWEMRLCRLQLWSRWGRFRVSDPREAEPSLQAGMHFEYPEITALDQYCSHLVGYGYS